LFVETVLALANVLAEMILDFLHLLLRKLDLLSLLATRLARGRLRLLHALVYGLHISNILLVVNHYFHRFVFLFGFPIRTRFKNCVNFANFQTGRLAVVRLR